MASDIERLRRVLLDIIPFLSDDPVQGAYAVVGGMALQLHYGFEVARTTFDVDAVVILERWDDFEALANRLTGAGWRRVGDQKFVNPTGSAVDLLPYPLDEVTGRTITFPRTGSSLSTIGMMEAVQTAEERTVAGVQVRLARPENIAVLKAVAFFHRNEIKDARDLTLLAEQFGDLEEVLEVLGTEEVENAEEARALLLSRVAVKVVPEGRPLFDQLAALLESPEGDLGAQLWRRFARAADFETFIASMVSIGRGLRRGATQGG